MCMAGTYRRGTGEIRCALEGNTQEGEVVPAASPLFGWYFMVVF